MSEVQLKLWFSSLDGSPDERDAPCRQSKEVAKIMKKVFEESEGAVVG